ncbi:proline--tRNA ligase [Paenibacillus sp. J22TS3]|uniref:proline--tRNA ligase n=1 Tax=Paenibacillus sp. J22TS3 TaxID=2807192 RepID=UPI001B0C9377|nr:proline--tRNA ligase [Paenibacillus sp. J22TS3]GIP22524.1 proline--tRNA ligase [Paenibacillus sp. J22TS3]
MKQSRLLMPTLREAPADAEAQSHRLLLRAGFIRQLASGVYTYLPLGWRVLQKASAIVREEMNLAGAQELLMPAMQPAELWKKSGRYEVYGPELIRLEDRHGREFALGPTHEEVITALVRDEISSYRQLPLTLYQIQTKFRDERRPRFGLLRGREFLMKDAYSFDTDWDGLDASYWAMHAAYTRIFTRCGLDFRSVHADAGAIGGEGETHEFMALADIGEDTIAVCPVGDYAANLEKAGHKEVALRLEAALEVRENQPAPELISTPDVHTIQELTSFTGIPTNQFIKTLIYLIDGKPTAVLVRGDHEVNEIKVKNYMKAETVELADAKTVLEITGAPVGFAGPVGLHIPLLIDSDVARMDTAMTGANQADYHLSGVRPGIDFPLQDAPDLRNAIAGDPCPHCGQPMSLVKGIEIGHVFKLGTKYSDALGAVFSDASGQENRMVMGCYGIGISRLLSAVAEQHHDGNGLIWPSSLAPYQVHLVPLSLKDEVQSSLVTKLYEQLTNLGIEVLLDDRDERAGIKFKDSDLIGIPVRIVIGKMAKDGLIEWKERCKPEAEVLSVEAAVSRLTEHHRQ